MMHNVIDAGRLALVWKLLHRKIEYISYRYVAAAKKPEVLLVHVMDFTYSDWFQYHWNDPIWAHHAARFKFTKLLQKQTHCFDRAHFTVSVDARAKTPYRALKSYIAVAT